MKAKDLCSYIMTITQKSPKQFRFTFVSRLQNLALDVIDRLFRANETFFTGPDAQVKYQKRIDYQHEALTSLKLLGYVAQLAMEQQCILARQYEQIAHHVADCQNMLGAWINSDRKRFQP